VNTLPTEAFMVAAGYGSRNYYSYDGVVWRSGSGTSGDLVAPAVWNGQYWAVCGTNGVFRSPDGINWASTNGSNTNGIAWNGQMWVRYNASAGTMQYSYDLSTWANGAGPGTLTANGGDNRAIAWGGDRFICGIYKNNNSVNYIFSFDGINWINGSNIGGISTSGVQGIFGIAYNGSTWVMTGTGSSSNIFYSTNGGDTWSNAASGATNAIFNKVAWNGSLWVATAMTGSSNCVFTSPNGINWTSRTVTGFQIGTQTGGVTWNGNAWYVIGSNAAGNSNAIASSVDGITWTTTILPLSVQWMPGIASRKVLPFTQTPNWANYPAALNVNLNGSNLSNVQNVAVTRPTTGFLPTSYPNLVLWLDASDSSSLTLSTSNVTAWRDKSGQGNHPIVNTSGGTPTWNSTRRSVITGGGTFDVEVPTNPREYGFFVFQAYNTSPSDFFSANANYARRIQVGTSDINFSTRAITWIIYQDASLANAFTASNTNLFRFDTTSRISLNGGTRIVSGTALSNVANGFTTLNITSVGGTGFELMEAVVYNNIDMTATQISTVEGYLAWKWGITARLPAGHAFKTINPGTIPQLVNAATFTPDSTNSLVLNPSSNAVTQKVRFRMPTETRQIISNVNNITLLPTTESFGATYLLNQSNFAAITLPTLTSATDTGGSWLFYNNSASTQSITVTGTLSFTSPISLASRANIRITWTGSSYITTTA
jgi:hypothetical protein